jgi:hypothetical protein
MKRNYRLAYTIIICALLFFGCNMLQQETIIKIGNEELQSWEVNNDDNIISILLFPIESDFVPNRTEMRYYLNVKHIYIANDVLNSILECFSKRELLEAEAFEYITKIGDRNKVTIPVLFNYALIKDLFTLRGNDIIMENPYTGSNIILRGVDYVKFVNTPLIPVPKI